MLSDTKIKIILVAKGQSIFEAQNTYFNAMFAILV